MQSLNVVNAFERGGENGRQINSFFFMSKKVPKRFKGVVYGYATLFENKRCPVDLRVCVCVFVWRVGGVGMSFLRKNHIFSLKSVFGKSSRSPPFLHPHTPPKKYDKKSLKKLNN